MVTAAENAQLTRTGPSTVMGDLFRRYWVPFLQSHDIPEPDCPPVRVSLLSEKLVAFRDTDGNIGLISEFCAHRGVSLWFGRNEEGGIRCPYHGWKYDYQGNCLELPSENNAEAVCRRMKLTSYPCIERGGVIWTYLGPPEHQPGAGHRHLRAGREPPLAGVQLPAGHGRRDRRGARFLAAQRLPRQ